MAACSSAQPGNGTWSNIRPIILGDMGSHQFINRSLTPSPCLAEHRSIASTTKGSFSKCALNRRIRLNTLLDSKITDDGTIYQNDQAVARIQVTDFEDYDYLEKYGETYYQPIEGAKTTTADAQVKSGYLEMANVQIVSEMVNLISITRAYESNQKVVQTIDGTLDVAANQIGKL